MGWKKRDWACSGLFRNLRRLYKVPGGLMGCEIRWRPGGQCVLDTAGLAANVPVELCLL